MDVCAPKDGFVAKLFVRHEERVTAGSPLAQMDSEQEDRIADRVQTLESVREIRSMQYTGPQLELLRRVAKIAIDLAREKSEQAQRVYDLNAKQYDLGLLPPLELDRLKSELAQRILEQAKAEAQQKQLEYAVIRHNQTDELAKQLSENQKALILRRKERLKLLAPRDGHVKLLVAEGSFAEIGSVLMEIV